VKFALRALVLLHFLGACSANPTLAPGQATPSAAKNCLQMSCPAAGCGTLPGLCVEAVDRIWPRADWSRIVLTGLASTRCVRVMQRNGNDLGYDASDDAPCRSELQLEPIAGQARLLISDGPGGGTAAEALTAALGDLDLRVELFDARCSQVCRSSHAKTTISFAPADAVPYIDFAGSDVGTANNSLGTCSLANTRAFARASGSGDDDAASDTAKPDAGAVAPDGGK
jgi:hypothetical protein